MEYFPAALEKLVEQFARLPGIGSKSAQRLAFFVLSLPEEEAKAFFASQSYCGLALLGGEVVGLYILHPNNVGRCGHIANASYAVKDGFRGHHIGESLVRDCLFQAARLGFRLLQFNAVVAKNHTAIRLYERMGFTKIGMVPKGFLAKNGLYEDIFLYYIELI